jgi:hypothetical protein
MLPKFSFFRFLSVADLGEAYRWVEMEWKTNMKINIPKIKTPIGVSKFLVFLVPVEIL